LTCDTKTIDLLIESCNVGFVSAERLNELRTITKTHFQI